MTAPTLPETRMSDQLRRPRGRPRVSAETGFSAQMTWKPGPGQAARIAAAAARVYVSPNRDGISRNAFIRDAVDDHLCARDDGATYRDRTRIPSAGTAAQWIPGPGQRAELAAAAAADGLAIADIIRLAVEDYLQNWEA